MGFFLPQNPGIGGLDELTLSEEEAIQTIASLGAPGYILRTNLAGTGIEWVVSGAGSGYSNLTQFVDQTQWRSFYSNGSGDVVELAFGTAGKVLTSNGVSAAPTWETPSGGGSGTPGGSDTQVQFNDSSAFGGDAGLVYNKTTDTLTTGILIVTDDAYAAGWNGSSAVPTKNAVYDKIESLSLNSNVDGGSSSATYLITQVIDGGAAS